MLSYLSLLWATADVKGRPSISMPTDTEEDEFEWIGMLNNVSGYKLTLIASSFYSTSDVQILLIRKSEMKSIEISKKKQKKKLEYRCENNK